MAEELGEQVRLWMILPSVGFLLCMAILPLAARTWARVIWRVLSAKGVSL
jgi:hypothetical protein